MIKTRVHAARLSRQEPGGKAGWLPCLLASFLWFGGLDAQAGPAISLDTPAAFFTNAAIRLLVGAGYTVGAPGSTSNLLITVNDGGVPVTTLHIPISPINFYTPSVHRLLQLAANVYDATTNRVDLNPGAATPYPYLPSVFRPLFEEGPRDLAGRRQVFIVGYDQPNAEDLNPNGPFLGSSPPHDLSDDDDLRQLGTVQIRHMVYNVPLVIGARKGWPGFDEFAVDTQIQAARQLIFHRTAGSDTGPINEIDPVYLLTVTNVVGLQAWNSYATPFPRTLQMQVWPDISVLVTNTQTGKLLNPAPQRYAPAPTNIPAITSWPGSAWPLLQSSFITPLGSPTASYVFIPTNSVYSFANDQFVVNGSPDRTPGATNFSVPQWQLTVKARLRFALVDTAANQVVDYLNVASSRSVDLTEALMLDAVGGFGCSASYSPVYSSGAMWCTNVNSGFGVDPRMTFGVRLQIDASKGNAAGVNWNNSLPDPIFGTEKARAIARFKAQFFPDPSYLKVNTFLAPFQPFRNVHVVTLWQARDPLVHYTLGDLKNTAALTNAYYLDNFALSVPPTAFGYVNSRYEPWGGSPFHASVTDSDLTLKDPLGRSYGTSDDWDLPVGPLPGVGWLGRVHRGTPWQTLYLKSTPANLRTWLNWTGNDQLVTNLGQISTSLVPLNGLVLDASLTHPTNDWHLASLLVSLLSANDARQLRSANPASIAAWQGSLDGMMVLTNAELGQFETLIMSSNSPQAAVIATALHTKQAGQPGHYFHDPGDFLCTPEVSVVSPWLDTSHGPQALISDVAYEAIPAQLLPLLRPDSVGAMIQNGGTLSLQFSGLDGLAYAVQISPDLQSWTTLSTNYPVGGVFSLVDSQTPVAPCRFYRSVILP